MIKTLTLLACASLLLAAVCGERNLGPVPDGPFTTDSTGYVAVGTKGKQSTSYRFTVISRLQNRGSVPLYIDRCRPDSRQPLYSVGLAANADTARYRRHRSANDESAYMAIGACVGTDNPFEILPGEARIDTVEVRGPNEFDGHTMKPIGTTSGRFQMVVRVTIGSRDRRSGGRDSLF